MIGDEPDNTSEYPDPPEEAVLQGRRNRRTASTWSMIYPSSGTFACERCLFETCVHAPVAIHHLRDAEIDSN